MTYKCRDGITDQGIPRGLAAIRSIGFAFALGLIINRGGEEIFGISNFDYHRSIYELELLYLAETRFRSAPFTALHLQLDNTAACTVHKSSCSSSGYRRFGRPFTLYIDGNTLIP